MIQIFNEKLFKRIPNHSRTLSEVFLNKFGTNNSDKRGSSMMSDSLFNDLKFSNPEKRIHQKIQIIFKRQKLKRCLC